MSEYMIFCLGEGQYESKGAGYQKNYQVFNQEVDEEEWFKIKDSLSNIKISFLSWIDKKNMTDEEKKDYPIYKENGGYLKRITYEQAWSNWWNSASEADRNKILGLKQFDADIFKKITGIDVKENNLSGSEVEVKVNGRTYKAIIKKELK